MGRGAYYAPGLVVAALALIVYVDNTDQLPPWENWQHVLAGAGFAVGAALIAQLAMVGAQGAFAQVLPVPGGRSVRGRSAAWAGGLVLVWFGLGLVAAVLGAERIRVGPWVFAGISLAPLLLALGIYVWALPTAQRDFDPRA